MKYLEDTFHQCQMDTRKWVCYLTSIVLPCAKPLLAVTPPPPSSLKCTYIYSASSWIQVDSWEAQQPSYTPTLFTLECVFMTYFPSLRVTHELYRHFAKHLGAGITPVLLCGGDLLESFNAPGIWLLEHVEGW
jgi:hypothetical protein